MPLGTLPPQRLPESFRSLYRLLLRTTSASVLHRNSAVAGLRKIYRPDFEEAAVTINRLHSSNTRLTDLEKSRMIKWIEQWNINSMNFCPQLVNVIVANVHRVLVDKTLSLHYAAAVSKGIPDKVTSNRLRLSKHYMHWLERRLYSPPKPWKPDLGPSSAQYKPVVTTTKESKRSASESAILTANAWQPLDEVFKMAEGRDGISLGRVVYKKKRA